MVVLGGGASRVGQNGAVNLPVLFACGTCASIHAERDSNGPARKLTASCDRKRLEEKLSAAKVAAP